MIETVGWPWMFSLPAMVAASFLTRNDQVGSLTAGLIFLYLIGDDRSGGDAQLAG